jgi:L-arabinokinase
VRLPSELGVWGIDSGIRHAVTGADYGGVRVGAFMGYRILADMAGLAVSAGERAGHVRVTDPHWHGYLANVGVDRYERLAAEIPGAMSGAAFLDRYGGTTDAVTQVEAGRDYAVRTPTAHPIYEHARVTEWDAILRGSQAAGQAARLGALMYESHESYSACGLGSAGTDRLVELAREAGPEHGVHGAKITGGGSGGTVAVLCDAERGGEIVRAIAHRYSAETGRSAHIFEGSSPGAAQVGAVTLSGV